MVSKPRERTVFWKDVTEIIQRNISWGVKFEALQNRICKFDQDFGLVSSGENSDPENPHTFADPGPASEPGYRSFVRDWEAGETTGIHGHPNVMVVYVVSGTIEERTFAVKNEGIVSAQTRVFSAGEMIAQANENHRFDNFVHQIQCLETAWTLHIYSAHPARGCRYDADQVFNN